MRCVGAEVTPALNPAALRCFFGSTRGGWQEVGTTNAANTSGSTHTGIWSDIIVFKNFLLE